MNRVTLQSNDNAAEGVLYMAMELGDKRWKLVFSEGGAKRRHETVEAGRRMQLVEAIGKAKANFHLSPEARVVSCYEAGCDGFWLHRYLVSLGIENPRISTTHDKQRQSTQRLALTSSLSSAVDNCRFLPASVPPVSRVQGLAGGHTKGKAKSAHPGPGTSHRRLITGIPGSRPVRS
jgi:hypothetical protein